MTDIEPPLADPTVRHFRARVFTMACGAYGGPAVLTTQQWANVTCRSCLLEQPYGAVPAPGVREYQIPENVRQRDAQQAGRDGVYGVHAFQPDGSGARCVALVLRPDDLKHVCWELERSAIHDPQAYAEAQKPAAWLDMLAKRAKLMLELKAEHEMQAQISRMITELHDMRERSAIRAKMLEQRIVDIS
jgi:hypothetical protein